MNTNNFDLNELFKNENAKLVSPNGDQPSKYPKLGISWTTMIFGFFVPLFRKDWKWAGILIGAAIFLSLIGLDSIIGILPIAFGFFYNKIYLQELLAAGWKPATPLDDEKIRGYLHK